LVRSENQDAVLDRPDRGLWVVADGMGGHADGRLAAETVVSELAAVADDPPPTPREFLTACGQALGRAHRILRERAAQTPALRPPGSTVVTLLMRQRHFLCLWVGDSRAYRFRAGVLEGLTRDHTVVQDLLDGGHLSAAEALIHPARHALTRALGALDELLLEKTRDPVRAGDLFLLCSDGMSGVVSEGTLSACISAGLAVDGEDRARVQAILEGLHGAARDAGAPDNLSVIVILVGGVR